MIPLLVLISVAACGSDTTSTARSVAPILTQQADAVPAASVDPTSDLIPLADTPFAEILSMIPDLPELREQIALEDFSLLSELYGVDRPTLADLDSAGVGFADSLLSAVSSTPGPGRVADAPWLSGFHDFRARVDLWNNLGFDQRSVHLSALAGRGAFKLDVLTGNYDPARTSNAIAACEECQPDTIQNYRDVEYLGWGEDGRNNLRMRLKPPIYSALGVGGQLLVVDGAVYRAPDTEVMKKVIDVRSGEFPSLAENEDYSLIFRGLAMGGAINASIITGDYSSAGSLVGNGEVTISGSNTGGRVVVSRGVSAAGSDADPLVVIDTGVSLLMPFELAGMGVGFEDGRNFTVVALLHGTESAAKENIELLSNRVDQAEYAVGKTWSENISELEINTYGQLLVARLFHDSKNVILLDPNWGPGLIVHEP